MANLVLMITCETSIAHRAGALGRLAWGVLKQVPDSRWLLDRKACPWYPAMRLFQPKECGDWAEAFDRVAQARRGHGINGAG
jgi:hypothetical protein